MISGFRSLVSGLYAGGLQSPLYVRSAVSGQYMASSLRSPVSRLRSIYGLLPPNALWSQDASLRLCVKHNATRRWGVPPWGEGGVSGEVRGGMLIRLKFRTHFPNIFLFWSRNAISLRLPVKHKLILWSGRSPLPGRKMWSCEDEYCTFGKPPLS
jgi:hypothetical protein